MNKVQHVDCNSLLMTTVDTRLFSHDPRDVTLHRRTGRRSHSETPAKVAVKTPFNDQTASTYLIC